MSNIIGSTYTNPSTPLQIAFAIGLEKELKTWGTPDSYFVRIAERLRNNTNRLVGALRSVGVEVVVPTAGYCVVAKFNKLAKFVDLSGHSESRPGLKFWDYMFAKGVRWWFLSW